ncbi:ABC-2 type transport system ATP-binding protein [Paenibacillus rhizosphaerae]|uniref:ABC-2 type transport system ATP-binding protein n=1 Tax=Paenibacillus rhizosphaerae TaxID=297318 RepID=A0A839TQF4_9BACL|nr:ABC transporter ATP-binding protein [Paenibacillus rhizosphaerae]MBB3128952.1 ABC-2 type transport system ATP-binding protein [Paenibacillus rhizosphaerae]
MNRIVEVNRLTKEYGRDAVVKDVTFAVEEGKIYGLLGRNGAGKTTIMHMLTAQLFPSSGELKVFGENPYENNRVLSQLCFIKESQRYPDSYRVIDVLKVAASIYPYWDRNFAAQLLEDFRLPLKRRMKKLSRGMLSSVGIIIGLASRAPLTIFDEPYLGLDAVARSLFYERLMQDYAENPRTIMLSTHLIDEVSNMLEHVLVIDQGRLLIDEEADDLRGKAYTVLGPKAAVESFASGKNTIHQESIGGMMSVTLFERQDPTEKRRAEAQGLELIPISMQQLIVHLTQSKTSGKVAGFQ